MKKFVSMLLFTMLLGSMLEIPAFAEEASTQRIAYMNLETASAEMKSEILEAREEIIFNTDGWVADGWEGYVIDMQTGERVESVPEFHDIFPADWEIPVDQSTVNAFKTQKEDALLTRAAESVIFDADVYVRKATNVAANGVCVGCSCSGC